MPEYTTAVGINSTWTASNITMPSNYTITPDTSYPIATENWLPLLSSNDLKEYTEKTDKHVDELDADIEFLNNKRSEMEEYISNLEKRVSDLQLAIDALNLKISVE